MYQINILYPSLKTLDNIFAHILEHSISENTNASQRLSLKRHLVCSFTRNRISVNFLLLVSKMSFKSLSALRSSKKQPSPAYASVDQEEKGSSSYRSSEEEGIDTDGENLVPFITDTGRRIQKRFMAALCVNAGLFLVIIGLLVAQHTNQTPKKLLESPLPECV